MFTHRFQERITAPQPAVQPAFLPCPLMSAFSPSHQAFIADVYRVAREIAEARAAETAPIRVPAFSQN